MEMVEYLYLGLGLHGLRLSHLVFHRLSLCQLRFGLDYWGLGHWGSIRLRLDNFRLDHRGLSNFRLGRLRWLVLMLMIRIDHSHTRRCHRPS